MATVKLQVIQGEQVRMLFKMERGKAGTKREGRRERGERRGGGKEREKEGEGGRGGEGGGTCFDLSCLLRSWSQRSSL